MRISHAGYFLVFIPVVFQLVFVSILFAEIKKADEIIDEQSRAKLILLEFRGLIQKAQRAGMEMGKYSSLGKDPEYLENCNRILREAESEKKRLHKQVRLDNRYMRTYKSFDKDWNKLLASLKESQRLIEMPHVAKGEELMVLYQNVEESIGAMNNDVKDLLHEQNSDEEDAAHNRQSARDSLLLLIFFGTAFNIFIAGMLAHWYAKRVGSRIDLLMDNSLRLGRGAELNPPISGSDEIATLDRTFHKVADVITEGLARERALFDNAVDVICSLDSSGRITKVNSAFENTFGYQVDDVLECHLIEFIFADDQPATFEFLQNVKDSSLPSSKLENRVGTKNGGVRNVQWSVTWGESHKSYFCVAHDITDRKELERAKQDFINMISHDLRSPLTAIQGTFDLFLRGIYGEIQDKGVARIESAKKSIDRLIALISDLLDLEKLASGEMDISRDLIGADDVMMDAFEAVRGMAEMNQVAVKVAECELTVFADHDRLLQVFVNLLSNAIKFSPQDGVVNLSAVAIDNFVEFRIEDQGPGIPSSHLDSIFQRFKQVDRSDHTKKKGSGLGLAISKEIIQAHGGTIGVTSVVGEGSTFWFRIATNS